MIENFIGLLGTAVGACIMYIVLVLTDDTAKREKQAYNQGVRRGMELFEEQHRKI